jgi:hypothetical protein
VLIGEYVGADENIFPALVNKLDPALVPKN